MVTTATPAVTVQFYPSLSPLNCLYLGLVRASYFQHRKMDNRDSSKFSDRFPELKFSDLTDEVCVCVLFFLLTSYLPAEAENWEK